MYANISKLNDQLWTGGDLHDNGIIGKLQLDEIVRLGITAIIDTRAEFTDRSYVEEHAPQITYRQAPADDHGGEQPDRWWDEIIELGGILKDAGEVVLVHCHMGVNRGPSAAGIILTTSYGWNPITAWKHIRTERSLAWAIYMPDGLRFLGKDEQADKLEQLINDSDDGTMMETIGRIRMLQRHGEVINPISMEA